MKKKIYKALSNIKKNYLTDHIRNISFEFIQVHFFLNRYLNVNSVVKTREKLF